LNNKSLFMQHQDLIKHCQTDWQDYTRHTFVMQLGNGCLAQPCFLHYLKQDFLFLKHYARAYALAIYKANNLADMRQALPSVQALLDIEINHHITYCQDWGLTEADLEAEQEDYGTVAYTRYVLDTGMSGDLVELYAALAPCSIGYAEIGRLLAAEKQNHSAANPFASWIALYSGQEFQQSVADSTAHFDRLLAEIDINSQRGQRLLNIFKTATRMEVAFWEQGLAAAPAQ